MSIRRVLPLILVLGAFLIILLMLAVKSEAHTAEECDQLTQELGEWFEYEQWHGTNFLALEDLRGLLDEKVAWCSPKRTHTTHSRSTRSYGGGVEQWRPLVTQYFRSADIEIALCLIGYETGFTGNPNAKNPRSSAAGLFQFLRSTWDKVPLSVTGGTYDSGQVYQPEANVRSAAWLKDASGWSQWSPYNAGLC